MMLSEYLSHYVTYLEDEKGVSKNTVRTWRPMLRAYIRWCGGKDNYTPTALDFNLLMLRDYRTYLQVERAYRPRSQNSNLAALRGFGNYLVEVGAIPENPVDKMKPTKLDSVLRVILTDSEVVRLQDAIQCLPTPKERAFAGSVIGTLVFTAIRRQEFFDLKLSDIDFVALTVKVRKGKGAKTHVVKPAPELFALYRRWIFHREEGEKEDLWMIHKNMRMGTRTLDGLLDKLAGIAKIPHVVRPHQFRHNTLLYIVNNGGSIPDASAFVGHSSIKTTFEYLKGIDEGRLDATRAIVSRREKEPVTPTPHPKPDPLPPNVRAKSYRRNLR